MTQEFHISITPVEQKQYLVQTKKVALKVPLVEALVILPLKDWLNQYEQLVIEALNAVLQSDEKLVAENSGSDRFVLLQRKIINLGQQLYNFLFHGPLNNSWITAQAIAQKEDKVLRLCLEVNDLVLARLPWEIMHTGSSFLVTDSSIEFSRYQPGEMPATGLQQDIVKVLMAIAIPNFQDPLVLKQEATRLQAELGEVSLKDNLGNDKTQSCLEDSTDDVIAAPELDFLDDEWDQEEIKDHVEMDFVDEDEWEQDEPGYEEDSALVSDLFRQLTEETPTTAESSLISDSGFEQLSEVDSSAPQSMHSKIPHYADKPNKSNDSPTSVESTPATTNTSIERSPKSGSNPQKAQKILPILQAVGVTLITFGSFLWFQRQLQQVSPPIPVFQAVNDNLKTASTPKLQAIAIEHFRKGNLSDGSLAVEELLNRGALTSAKTALNAVSDAPQTSEINFLRGRLGWQLIKTGDKNYSFDDVRRYWETAVKHKPDSPRYYSALGFLYYSQGKLNKANQTWFQALYLTEEQKANKTTSTPVVTKRDQLNAYAGLALVLSKSAKNQPTDKQAKLLSEAIKLRQQVLTDDPVNFQPERLSKTWLWTEKTIQDWRSLLQHQG